MYYYDEMNAKLVSLNNVKSVELDVYGSGAKSNPFQYTIVIQYFGDEKTHLSYKSASDTAETALRNICEKLGCEL